MAAGDGVRWNVATIAEEERDRLLDAFRRLAARRHSDGSSYWEKQVQIRRNARHGDQDVRDGAAFLPWNRELCNRLEGLLREVDPGLALHYWDWTTDPRSCPDGRGGVVDLFTSAFMGCPDGDAGPPLGDFASCEAAELGNGRARVWRRLAAGPPAIPADADLIGAGDDLSEPAQYDALDRALEAAQAHLQAGYLGGSMADPRYAFHDPFALLLHANVDRLWAMWQTAPGRGWRLDPNRVYGRHAGAPSINANLEPWSGGSGLRPWAPPDDEGIWVKTSKHPSVVAPPRYDTTPASLTRAWVTAFPSVAPRPPRELDLFAVGLDGRAYAGRWRPSGIAAWQPIGGSFPPGAPMSAVARRPDVVDLFVTGNDGRVYTSRWRSGCGWRAIGGSFPTGAPVSAVASRPDAVDLFVVGSDDCVHTSWWSPDAGWSGRGGSWQAIGGSFPPGAPVSAASAAPGDLRLFATAGDGRVYASRRSPGGGRLGDDGWTAIGGPFPPAAPMTAVASGADVRLFLIGGDGRVHTRGLDGGWAPIGGSFPPGAHVSVAAMEPGVLDLFVVGGDGRVHTARWSADRSSVSWTAASRFLPPT